MSFLTRFLGRGEAAVTVPAMDGGLKPNNLLEDLPGAVPAKAPGTVVNWQGAALWSEGSRLVSASGQEVLSLEQEITALAATDDRIALAMGDEIRLFDAQLQDITPGPGAGLSCVTALAFDQGHLWVCSGSDRHKPQDWRRDLMELNRRGSVSRIDLGTGAVSVVKTGLGYPAGIAVHGGKVAVSEAWRSQIIGIGAGGETEVLLDELPGYPGHLSPRPGGYWLCIFAPRSPLFEFVLREPAYRKAMLETVHPDHWVAPKYASGEDFNEPMQGGALKQMGILKPWAPTLSYGLVVALNDAFIPQFSFHSRAGGKRHGITGAAQINDELTLAGRGSNEVLTLNPNAGSGA